MVTLNISQTSQSVKSFDNYLLEMSGLKIKVGATVCEDCVFKGDISIAGGTVIHPRATIIAEGGPIIISEYCIIEEYAVIIHKVNPDADDQSEIKKPLIIGPHNVFEVGCKVEAYAGHIGESNVFECKSYVGPKVTIGNGCVIGAGCKMEVGTMTDNTVVYGSEHIMREAMEKQPSHMLQLDFLGKILPNYHQLRKPNVQAKKPSSKPAPDS